MCVETKRIVKSKNVVFIEGWKDIGGVLHPKKVEILIMHAIVNKEVKGEKPLTFN
jgi:hypothetical protein